ENGIDYRIASGGGRMLITMDRYNADWGMVEKGWQTHVLGQGQLYSSAVEAIELAYKDLTLNDQYCPPFVVADNEGAVGTIEDGDIVVMMNFRGDRAIEISKAFEEKDFVKFDRQRVPNVTYIGMMEYDGDLHIPQNYLISPPEITNPVSTYLCDLGLRSFALSETQKFGHVTYFWNGNCSGYIDKDLEDYIEISSDNIPFDQRPEMKAFEIAKTAVERLETGGYHFARINFPNGDMVGHTGNLDAAIKAVEVTDQCVGEIVDAVNKLGGVTIVLADHGNAELMSKTAHTLNAVPFVIEDARDERGYVLSDVQNAGLANVAATICHLLGYEPPADYEPSLIRLLK
ncbi:2,3-bisphosphoglycerate-independent phosphoglycerate mutase, partial [Candidatus Marinamargulisbacteria bacterium SCGC AG-439-L15]